MVLKKQAYRDRVAASIGRIGDMMVLGGYPVLASAALLPILVEHITNPAGAYGALASLLGGIGGNLIANIVQGTYDKARSEDGEYDVAGLAAILEKQMQANNEISEALALLVHESQVIRQASEILQELPEQWDTFAKRLLDQIQGLDGTSIVIESLHVDHLAIIRAKVPPSAESLIPDHLRLLAAATDHLRLGTIDPKFEIDSPIKLSQIYVNPLVQEMTSPMRGEIGRASNPLMVISRMFGKGDARGIVLLGGPGAGKSALLDRLANILSLAILKELQKDVDEADSEATRERIPGWIAPLVLPVKVSLQEFAARSLPADAKQGAAGFLWEHIREKLRANALSDFAAPLNLILSGKMDLRGRRRDQLGYGGLILLDGLDEVPRHQRSLVEQTIDKFSMRFNQSVVVVTCRTYSWTESDKTSRPGGERRPLTVYEVAPFSEAQIGQFVERWYAAVRSLKHMTDEAVEHRIETLQAATKIPTLIPLAQKPLLLTLMATLHTSRGQLPQDRATLYADCVDLLLEVWQRAKDLHIGGRTTIEGGLLEEFGVSSANVERVLRKIAYDLHITSKPGGQVSNHEEPRVAAEELRKAFRPLAGNSWDEADRLVSYLQRRAGLLEYDGDEAYSFPHRTFREFLVACYLLDEPESPTSLIRLFLSEPTWWAEVFSLAVGRQSNTSYSQAAQILDATLRKAAEEPAQQASTFAILLDTARDIDLVDRQTDSPFYSLLLNQLIRAFLSHSTLTLDSSIGKDRGSIFANSSQILVPYVLPLLEDTDVGDTAAIYIGLYGDKELVSQVLSLFKHEEPSVRARAAHALGGIGDYRVVDSLVRLSREDETPEVVLKALAALGKLGGDKAISALIDEIEHRDTNIRRFALEELGRIGDETVVNELCKRIQEADIDTAQHMIGALASIANDEAIEALIELLSDEELSSLAADALIEIGPGVIPWIRDVYEETDEYALIDHCRYILGSLPPSRIVPWLSGYPVSGERMLWREEDSEFTDYLMQRDS